MSNLHHIMYQSYIRLMHGFCQYPRLLELLDKVELRSKVRVLAIGKAAWKMASLCREYLISKGIAYDGIVLTKNGLSHGALQGLKVVEAGHPLPDEQSLIHSAKIMDWLKSIPVKDHLIVLLSGGSSSLFEMLPDGVSLQELINTNALLLKSGKDIAEINRARAELSLVKHGKALSQTKVKRISVFAVSDVAGNDPHTIGSGPFTPQSAGRITSTGWHYSISGKTLNYHIVADNHSFCSQLCSDLQQQDFRSHYDSQYHGRSVASFSEILKEVLRKAHLPRYRFKPPFIHIFGGELQVRVTGSGKGGRCSHLALSLAGTLGRYPDTALFCFATDGNDNIAGNGGAYIDSNTPRELIQAGIRAPQAQKNYDSFTALKQIHHILPSPLLTTNVNDVFVLCVGYDLENPLASNPKDEIDLFDGLN